MLTLNLLYLKRIHTEKILFLIPITTRSEKIFYEPIISELSLQGHSVTVTTSFLSPNLPSNVTEIMPSSFEEMFAPCKQATQVPLLSLMTDTYDYFGTFCHKIYQNEDFQRVISQQYDLVISTVGASFCFYGILHQMQAPYILMESFPVAQHYLNDLGTILPSSSVPHPFLTSSNKMTFSERLLNFAVNWFSHVQYRWNVYPKMEQIYREYLGSDVPSVIDILKNASLIMMNTHFTTTGVRPLAPNTIEIGCTHCKAPKPLPKVSMNLIHNQ